MMKSKNWLRRPGLLIFLILLFCNTTITAQTSIKGFIKDAVTQEPLAL